MVFRREDCKGKDQNFEIAMADGNLRHMVLRERWVLNPDSDFVVRGAMTVVQTTHCGFNRE